MAKRKIYPSREELHSLLRYENGKLYWRERDRKYFLYEHDWKGWNRKYSGKEAGSKHKYNARSVIRYRWIIGFNNKHLLRSNVIWIMFNGEIPPSFMIDHIDNDTLNDEIDNLRLATSTENGCNRSIQRNNKCGYKGVFLCKANNKYQAQIVVNKKRIFLGYYECPEEAHQVYVEAAKKHFGEFYNPG